MKRPDAMIIKRILSNKNVRGDSDGGHIVKRAMEVPLLDFSSKDDARDWEWAQPEKILLNNNDDGYKEGDCLCVPKTHTFARRHEANS